MFETTLASIRYGMGLSPVWDGPSDVQNMLDQIAGEDRAARDYKIPSFESSEPELREVLRLRQAEREAVGTSAEAATKEARVDASNRISQRRTKFLLYGMARSLDTNDGLRERLVAFWADHFAIRSTQPLTSHLVAAFVEDTIRPNVAGNFADMLKAVIVHPMMLMYLQQVRSIGPNSKFGVANRARNVGINENLARELLELHTLGVNGQYNQFDVEEAAELLTGLTYRVTRGMEFDPNLAEPGAETVLGVTYRAHPSLENVMDFLDALARHPSTAQNIARKLAVHFIADQPDETLVQSIADTFLETDGDLFQTISVLLESDAAWVPELQKVKRPFEFIVSSLRALGVSGEALLSLDQRSFSRLIDRPLRAMGQRLEFPPGPDGWPEASGEWITPNLLAARVMWAFQAPQNLVGRLPDPREFVDAALSEYASQSVKFAASAADARADGIGVILASAAFQRR